MLIDIRNLRVALGEPSCTMSACASRQARFMGRPNGAGKSTTIAAALGLVRASGGTVRVLGADPRAAAKAIHGRLGVLPEQNGFYGWMTARDYLRFFSRLYGRERGDRDLGRGWHRLDSSPTPASRSAHSRRACVSARTGAHRHPRAVDTR